MIMYNHEGEIELARNIILNRHSELGHVAEYPASRDNVRVLVVKMETILKAWKGKTPYRKAIRLRIISIILNREVFTTNDLQTFECSGLLRWITNNGQGDSANAIKLFEDIASDIEGGSTLPTL
jgi:hypothetical protein